MLFENGKVTARTEIPIDAENHVTMDKGILSPSRQEVGSFEDVREKAFAGSDYDDSGYGGEEISALEAIITLLLAIGLPIGLIVWIRKRKKKKAEKERQRFSERFGYFRRTEDQADPADRRNSRRPGGTGKRSTQPGTLWREHGL